MGRRGGAARVVSSPSTAGGRGPVGRHAKGGERRRRRAGRKTLLRRSAGGHGVVAHAPTQEEGGRRSLALPRGGQWGSGLASARHGHMAKADRRIGGELDATRARGATRCGAAASGRPVQELCFCAWVGVVLVSHVGKVGKHSDTSKQCPCVQAFMRSSPVCLVTRRSRSRSLIIATSRFLLVRRRTEGRLGLWCCAVLSLGMSPPPPPPPPHQTNMPSVHPLTQAGCTPHTQGRENMPPLLLPLPSHL